MTEEIFWTYAPWAFGIFLLFWLWDATRPNPLRLIAHVNYISGTLGTGKTSFVALCARHLRKKKIRFYSTFQLEGAIPFNMDTDDWPDDEGVWIFIDELLALESKGFIDKEKLADGCAFARQNEQYLIFLSQNHRPDFPRPIWGTIQRWFIVSSINAFGGKISMLRRSDNPFIRRQSFKGENVKRFFFFIPGSIFKSYNSKVIYGYTYNSDGTKMKFKFKKKPKPHPLSREARQAREAAALQLAGLKLADPGHIVTPKAEHLAEDRPREEPFSAPDPDPWNFNPEVYNDQN